VTAGHAVALGTGHAMSAPLGHHDRAPAVARGIAHAMLNRVNDKLANDCFCLISEPIQTPGSKDFPGEMPCGSG
jgi:hypothetical protein